jgi:hypothetical protein
MWHFSIKDKKMKGIPLQALDRNSLFDVGARLLMNKIASNADIRMSDIQA